MVPYWQKTRHLRRQHAETRNKQLRRLEEDLWYCSVM